MFPVSHDISMLFITMFLYDVVTFLLFVPYETQVKDRPFNLQGGGYGYLFRSDILFRTTQEL